MSIVGRLAELRTEQTKLLSICTALTSRLCKSKGRLAASGSRTTTISAATPLSASKSKPKSKPKSSGTKPVTAAVNPAPTAASDTGSAESSSTVPLYYDDSYLFETAGSVVAIKDAADGETAVIAPATIFHPQGGGQPADTGTIVSESGAVFTVRHVVKAPGGVIEHLGKFATGAVPFAPGTTVTFKVDEAPRKLNARVHSAGHLLDAAVTNVGRTDLKPTKGYHFSSGAYVEYVGTVAAPDREALVAKVNEEFQRLVKTNADVVVKMDNGVRMIETGGVWIACGGTHVKALGEIGEVVVTKIKKVKTSVRFSYKMV